MVLDLGFDVGQHLTFADCGHRVLAGANAVGLRHVEYRPFPQRQSLAVSCFSVQMGDRHISTSG